MRQDACTGSWEGGSGWQAGGMHSAGGTLRREPHPAHSVWGQRPGQEKGAGQAGSAGAGALPFSCQVHAMWQNSQGCFCMYGEHTWAACCNCCVQCSREQHAGDTGLHGQEPGKGKPQTGIWLPDPCLATSCDDARLTMLNLVPYRSQVGACLGPNMQMKAFCREGSACRHKQLVAYFGEEYPQGRCGRQCDNCLRASGRQPHPEWYIEVGFCSKSSLLRPAQAATAIVIVVTFTTQLHEAKAWCCHSVL